MAASCRRERAFTTAAPTHVCLILRRCLGPPRAEDFGLGAHGDVTEARNAAGETTASQGVVSYTYRHSFVTDALENGVAELSLFRHFQTKAQLFEEAAIEPIHDFLREWIREWTDRPSGPGTASTRSRTSAATLRPVSRASSLSRRSVTSGSLIVMPFT